MKLKTFLIALLTSIVAQAQTNVTTKYIDNPDFAARFAGWENLGMTFQTTKDAFLKSNGEIWMEKWVNKGSKVGSGFGIQQRLVNLEPGTYTLKVAAQNVQQESSATQTGAYVFAGNKQVDVNACAEYEIRFTLLTGTTQIGIKTQNATGNWVCVDNFRLYYEGYIEAEAQTEMQRLISDAESSYKEDGKSASYLKAAIDAAKSFTSEDAGTKAKALLAMTNEYRRQNSTDSAPRVTTHPYIATGVTVALGRATFTGSNIVEKGFCWSTQPEPSINDDRSTVVFENNGDIYCMNKMQPATIYYVRAYAITKNHNVGYGNVVKMATLPQGKVTCDYDYASGDYNENFRINSAILECIWLYNNLCNMTGKNISVHYVPGAGAGDGTADCNINGWMRVSQKYAYQQTGTMLHETNHGVGVGTTDSWYNNPVLRAETSRGTWLGPRATQMVRFMDNSETSTLTGDGTHMWPYGINGAHEDVYNPEKSILYYANALVTHALHQDGLCYQWWGTAPVPAYVFTQMDEAKYYLKCEDESCGMKTGFLTASGVGNVKVVTATVEEAKADDNYAWNITYNPATSKYIFKNVGTGKYLSYSSDAIKLATKTTLSSAEDMQLMPSRNDVTMGTKFKHTSYWITKDCNKALVGNGTSNCTTANWDNTNSATKQRWLFLTEDDLTVFDSEIAKSEKPVLNTRIKQISGLLDTPHEKSQLVESELTTEDIDQALQAAVAEAQDVYSTSTSSQEILSAENALMDAAFEFLSIADPTDLTNPFNLSFYLKNADITTTSEGWTDTPTIGNSVAEFFQKGFDFNQTTLQKMPAGTYMLRVSAFQRPGAYDTSYTDYTTNGSKNVDASIYMKTKAKQVKNIWEDAQAQALNVGGSSHAKSMDGKYIPNDTYGASRCFKNDYYQNEILASFAGASTMKIGIKGTNTGTGFWTCFDDFRLLYFGQHKTTTVTGIEGVQSANTKVQKVYDMQGRLIRVQSAEGRVQNLKSGMYIINGKKVIF